MAEIRQNGFVRVIAMTFQRVDGYTPSVWPAAADEQQQMEHLDFHVKDVEKAVEYNSVMRRNHVGNPMRRRMAGDAGPCGASLLPVAATAMDYSRLRRDTWE